MGIFKVVTNLAPEKWENCLFKSAVNQNVIQQIVWIVTVLLYMMKYLKDLRYFPWDEALKLKRVRGVSKDNENFYQIESLRDASAL